MTELWLMWVFYFLSKGHFVHQSSSFPHYCTHRPFSNSALYLLFFSFAIDQKVFQPHIPCHCQRCPKAPIHRPRSAPCRCKRRTFIPLFFFFCRQANLFSSPRPERSAIRPRRCPIPLPLHIPQLARSISGNVSAEPDPRAATGRESAGQRSGAIPAGRGERLGRKGHPQHRSVHDDLQQASHGDGVGGAVRGGGSALSVRGRPATTREFDVDHWGGLGGLSLFPASFYVKQDGHPCLCHIQKILWYQLTLFFSSCILDFFIITNHFF